MNPLIWPLVRNLGSGKLNREKIGYRVDRQFDAIQHGEAQAYAWAIKDSAPYLNDASGFVTPFYPSRPLASLAKEMMALKGLHLNLLRLVHGEQEVRWHHPVKVGDRLKFTLVIERIEETLAGDLLILSGKCFKQDLLMNETKMGFLVRRKTNVEKRRKTQTALKERFRLPFQTNDGQQLLYAKASEDDNFIHTNHLLARLAGLPRTIMQGICVLAMTCSALSEKLIENDPSRLVAIKGRFAHFVLPGQGLEIVGYEGKNPSEVHFEVFNPFGRKVIRNGSFRFRAR